MSDWRKVKEPETLRSVLRTGGGMPVPFAAAWTSENDGYVVRKDPILLARGSRSPCLFEAHGAPGEGHAKLAVVSPSRQRVSSLGLECQVCRAPVGKGDPPWDPPLWLADLRSSQTSARDQLVDESGRQAIRVGGRARPLIYEPWLCEPCLVYSLRACRGLLGMRRKGILSLWRVRSAVFVETWEHPLAPPEDGPRVDAVVTYLKIAIMDGEEVPPHELLREHPR